ncbi:hypothetical protein GF327_07260 [Candidatus Woesearchaeota archaeon]|nr:hypothetical protein [Candidatus Woesearchaeota archaeon]
MIKISQNDINVELDQYIEKRVKRKPAKKRKKSKTTISDSEFDREEMEFNEGKEPFLTKIIDLFTVKKKTEVIRDIDEVEQKVQQKIDKTEEKEFDEYDDDYEENGILSKILDFFRFSYDEYDDENDFEFEQEKVSQEILPEDVKNIIKIQHKWINKLPSEKIKEFKKSEDFKLYKDILQKYNLIKR